MTPEEFLASRPRARTGRGRSGGAAIGGTLRIPRPGRCGIWCWKVKLPKRKMSCTDICVGKNKRHPALKIFVGGILPRAANSSGNTLFQLYQGKKWVDSGSFFTFGQNVSKPVNLLGLKGEGKHKVNDTTHYIAEEEVTSILIKEHLSPEKPLLARLVSGVLRKVPQPLVIIKELRNNLWIPIVVNIHPRERKANYGDLLGTFKDAQINLNSDISI